MIFITALSLLPNDWRRYCEASSNSPVFFLLLLIRFDIRSRRLYLSSKLVSCSTCNKLSKKSTYSYYQIIESTLNIITVLTVWNTEPSLNNSLPSHVEAGTESVQVGSCRAIYTFRESWLNCGLVGSMDIFKRSLRSLENMKL